MRGCMPGRGGFLSSLPHQTFPDELSNPNKIPLTISEKPSYRDLAEQALYIYEMFGPDILAIGTDFFGLLNVEEPEGLRDITGVANLFAELRDRGLVGAPIRMGENLEREEVGSGMVERFHIVARPYEVKVDGC